MCRTQVCLLRRKLLGLRMLERVRRWRGCGESCGEEKEGVRVSKRAIYRPLVKYFGSKWSLAKYYPAPRYDTIIGACAGGAGYESWWGADKHVILADDDPEVRAIWSWLLRARPADILQLPCAKLILGHDLRDSTRYPLEAADLIRRWQRVGRNDCWTVSKWNNTGGQWQESVKRAIVDALPHIRGWEVAKGGYESLPDIEATYFVDPPYQKQPKSYKHNAINYKHLGEWCRTRKGQVIVCEREGADWLPFVPFRTLNAGCAHHPKKTMTEVVWTNDM